MHNGSIYFGKQTKSEATGAKYKIKITSRIT